MRCRTQEQADECKTYQRHAARMAAIKRDRSTGGVKTNVVTVEEIDKAIEILKRVKQQMGA